MRESCEISSWSLLCSSYVNTYHLWNRNQTRTRGMWLGLMWALHILLSYRNPSKYLLPLLLNATSAWCSLQCDVEMEMRLCLWWLSSVLYARPIVAQHMCQSENRCLSVPGVEHRTLDVCTKLFIVLYLCAASTLSIALHRASRNSFTPCADY